MKNTSHLSDNEIDALLLAQADTRWLKVARIISPLAISCEVWDESDADRVTQRVIALVDAGNLESVGDVNHWRFSEVRLPARRD